MEQLNSQNNNATNEPVPKKNRNKKRTIIISAIVAVVLIVVAIVLYVYLYKIPRDEAIANYNEVVASYEDAVSNYNKAVDNYNNSSEQYNIAVAALADRNEELDNHITSLTQLINTENIPIDDLLLMEPNNILMEARNIPKDSAPALPPMPVSANEIIEETSKNINSFASEIKKKSIERIKAFTCETISATIENIESCTRKINAVTTNITELLPEIEKMGEYSETINLISAEETKYQTMIDQFSGCKSELIWFSVDEKSTLLRFLVQLSNTNPYTLRGVTTEWIAYDKNDAIVGSFNGFQPDIPANSSIYYVGGAGYMNLSGTPARVEVKITFDGLLTNRQLPQITVNEARLIDKGYGWYTVSAECMTNETIQTSDIDSRIIVKDADGQIISVEFMKNENLPASIDANGKFIITEDFFDLPTKPATVELYVYYKM